MFSTNSSKSTSVLRLALKDSDTTTCSTFFLRIASLYHNKMYHIKVQYIAYGIIQYVLCSLADHNCNFADEYQKY